VQSRELKSPNKTLAGHFGAANFLVRLLPGADLAFLRYHVVKPSKLAGFMMRTILFTPGMLALAFGAILGHAPVHAQETAPPPHLSAVLGIFQFDLSGTGIAPMFAIRGTTPLASVLVLEAGVLAARPGQQFGGTSTMLVPEAQVQLALPFPGVIPYMGLGAGAAFDFRGEDLGRQNFVSLSGALGMRLPLGERVGIQAEFRGRGLGFDFKGSSAEYTVGMTWLR